MSKPIKVTLQIVLAVLAIAMILPCLVIAYSFIVWNYGAGQDRFIASLFLAMFGMFPLIAVGMIEDIK